MTEKDSGICSEFEDKHESAISLLCWIPKGNTPIASRKMASVTHVVHLFIRIAED